MVNERNGNIPAQEMETFLSPQDKQKEKVVSKYNMTKDVEADEYDPFTERKLENPTSDMDTLTHLLKASLGTGILAMPKAFMNVGLIYGIFFTILVAVVCTHCAYILIKCSHVLYKKAKKTQMTFPEVGYAAVQNGPKALRGWANAFKIFILVSLFATYFGTSSVYMVIIAENIAQVVAHYMNTTVENIELRIFIVCILIPLIFMTWIRDLKYLAPVSMIANGFMAVGLGITFYYLVGTGELQTDKITSMLVKPPSDWPQFFSLSIFAMEAIGVVMPLENSMKTPKSMLGFCGVLNKGMSFVTLVYILLGFLGYLRYGDEVKDSITLNLDINLYPAQVVKIAIAIAVFCTYGLQFFVCIEIMWNCLKDNFTKRPNFANYALRTIMVTLSGLLAIAVPTIGPFMGVIGAFCFSILGLIAPAFIEVITYWNIGFGFSKYIIWKNILVVIFGLFALVFGTVDAVKGIMAVYTS